MNFTKNCFSEMVEDLFYNFLNFSRKDFEKFKNNDPALLDYIESTMHARFPNPYGDRFSKQWLTTYTKKFLSNKKETIQRAVKDQIRFPGQNKRGGNVHDVEWEFALDEARSGKDYKQ